MEESMTRNKDEIVRHLEEGDPGHGAPCWVGHGPDVESCKRPSTFRVYGINLCPEHGEEAALGAFEEMHQDAHDLLERFDGPHVVALSNPWVQRVMAEWERTVPADELAHAERTEDALLRAFPFRADRADPETAADIADRFFGNGHPVDRWRDERQDIHHLMRVAFGRGMTWAVETLEQEREHAAAQCAYAVALTRGDHPQVLEAAAGAERVGDPAEKPA
jgi:hypothetical protein